MSEVVFHMRGRPVRFAAGQGRVLEPDPTVAGHARTYARSAGLPYPEAPLPYLDVDPDHAMKVADFYEAARHAPNDPAVRAAYDAMKAETLAQYRHLQKMGVTLEPWTQAGQPYADSKEMTRDARSGHLYFFTGGDFPGDHHLREEAPGTDGLTYNDVFRAVHDYFGHAMYGNQFGPRGEEHAFRTHARMFTPRALPAMAAETKGQNSWVNFGPHMRGPTGRLLTPSDPGFLPAPQRPYAQQKNLVLPAHLHQAGPRVQTA
jgi:hypothetical protein